MKERGMMPRQPRLIQLPLAGKIFLCLLALVYQGYLIALVSFLYTSVTTHSETIIEHPVDTTPDIVKDWTVARMREAIDADQLIGNVPNLTQGNSDKSPSKGTQQQGQLPRNGDPSYPLSTVGKLFFTNDAGQAIVCSGTAVRSLNRSVVDTAGHCLYWGGSWVQNLIFCPLYDNGNTPYGCWAARDLEAPSQWIDSTPDGYHYNYYYDLGMVIVSPSSQGILTDIVGGAGWAYNQPANQSFYAYGYPAAHPFDGQTRQSCEDSLGKTWQEEGGTVVSIPCNMTGGSSGGPWFIKVSGNWYLNGHNDFTSSMQPGHMFSPYYDDVWYALYSKAQRT
jgi:V8-like Glu-specific endopeptidase